MIIECKDQNAVNAIKVLLSQSEFETISITDTDDKFIVETNEGFCPECGEIIHNDSYIYIKEGHPYGDTTVYESICVGFRCHCGFVEEW